MDKGVEKAAAYLPDRLRRVLCEIPEETAAFVREIRLRAGAPLLLSTDDGERVLQQNGQLSALPTAFCLSVGKAEVAECVKRLCGYALHVHQEELKQGFLTADGCRAGLGGTVVCNEVGEPCSLREITSVCLRVARSHEGCADLVLREIKRFETGGVLALGLPSCGKTSLLRDVAKGLSEGRFGARKRVAVVDERSELALDGALLCCDVLRGIDKARGIERAVRCLSPEFLVFDEWTSEREADAVAFALASGVRVVTSLHAPSFAVAKRRAETAALLTKENFPVVVQLSADHGIHCVEVEEE